MATDPIPIPNSKFSPIPIQIPIIITQLKSYLYVTAVLEFYIQSDCSIKYFDLFMQV